MRGGRLNQRTVLGIAATGILVAGCGTQSDYKNNPRPPSPITITAAISGGRVEVSPHRFGAGPITLVVTNQTGQLRDLVLESTDQPGSTKTGLAAQHTGPINPQGTASLKADLQQGSYTVRVRAGHTIRPARLTVGRERASAQNQLLQP
jgi:hypothetical protein